MPDVDEWAEQLNDKFTSAGTHRTNETGLRLDVEPLIREALHDLWGLNPDTETSVEVDPDPTVTQRRSIDSIYGGVFVEYAWSMTGGAGPQSRAGKAAQLLGYLDPIRERIGTALLTGVVCDQNTFGFQIDIPAEDGGQPPPHEQFEWLPISTASCRRFLLLGGSFAKKHVTGHGLAQAFGPTNTNVGNFIQALAVTLHGRSPNDRMDTLLREWVRSTEIVYGTLTGVAGDLSRTIGETFQIPAQTCPSLTERLFVVHTYYSLIARFIAVEVLAIAQHDRSSQPSGWGGLDDDSLSDAIYRLDQGEIPPVLDATNLFEGGVFSWFHDKDGVHPDVLTALRPLLDELDRFAFPAVTFGSVRSDDNLRELYRRLVPQELRKQLGEFPTPLWLAEACLAGMKEEGIDTDTGRILDPTCGTGAFLLPILQKRFAALRARGGDAITADDVQAVLDGVAGFDINPIAVIATRSNIVFTMGNLADLGAFHLPVWGTDSIDIPSPQPAQGVMGDTRLMGLDIVELRTSLDEPFPIPATFTRDAQMRQLRHHLDTTLLDPDADSAKQRFVDGLKTSLDAMGENPESATATWDDTIAPVLEVLWERTRHLVDTDRDGVWPSVIENAFAPVFAGQFDVVVGNPPWLAWPKLPESWRHEVEPLWRQYGLWSMHYAPGERQRRYAQFNDIAALVFAVAIGRYTKPTGHVGFLVPQAFLIADPGARAFRQCHLKNEPGFPDTDIEFNVVRIEDWSDVHPFAPDAANRPVFLTVTKGTIQTFPITTTSWRRKDAGTTLNGTWSEVEPLLDPTDASTQPIITEFPASAWRTASNSANLLEGGGNQWQFGMGVNTRGAAGVFHVDVRNSQPPQGTIQVRNRPQDGRQAIARSNWTTIELPLVYPLLRGRDVRAWNAAPDGHILITQDPGDFSMYLGPDLPRRYPLAHRWLRRFVTPLTGRRRPNASWAIKDARGREGRDWARLQGNFKHLSGNVLVVVPEQHHTLVAAVVEPKLHNELGRRTIPIPNHKVVFCAVADLDEGLYLAAFLNSTRMRELAESFASTTALSPTTLSRLPIPAFQALDADARRLVDLARHVHLAPPDETDAKAKQHSSEMDQLVERLLTNATAVKPDGGQHSQVDVQWQASDGGSTLFTAAPESDHSTDGNRGADLAPQPDQAAMG